MTGGLFDPLGMEPMPPRRAAPRRSAPVVLAGLALAALATLLVVSWLRDDGDRGLPVAVAPIAHVQVTPKTPAPPPAVPPAPAVAMPAMPASIPPVRDDQEVEVQNGVRIVRPRRDPPAQGGLTVAVPAPGPGR